MNPGTYLDFGDLVPFRDEDEIVKQSLLTTKEISGRAQAAVRHLFSEDFAHIIEPGLIQEDDILPRANHSAPTNGFQEAQETFPHFSNRERVSQLMSRTARDCNFGESILRAYGERRAITGLRQINGGGRAEVEAAHIRPVEFKGSDIVSNGLALSGTAHWMFDCGIVGLADDLTITVSRQSNDSDAVKAMINSSGRLLPPERVANRPRAEFVARRQENCFKT